MRKAITVYLSLLVALTLGLALTHCGSESNGNGDKCECGTWVCGKPATAACAKEPADFCGKCAEGLFCKNGVCGACDCDELHGWVQGVVLNFPPASPPVPAQAALAAVDAMNALTNPNPTHLVETTSGANGAYKTDCFDMTNVALAIIMLVDDPGFDGTAGDLFPTYAGVAEIESNADRTCVENAPPAWAISNQLVGMLKQVPPLANIDTGGFAIVLVLDHAQNPVSGAKLKKADGSDLDVVVYPNANFTAFDGTETSANGIVLVPGPLGLTNVKAVKDGMTWEAGSMGVVSGFCFTRPLIAEE